MPGMRSRNIILLSDGTGNSAASLFKTNVRRHYGDNKGTATVEVELLDQGFPPNPPVH